jgi:hypothetical protein
MGRASDLVQARADQNYIRILSRLETRKRHSAYERGATQICASTFPHMLFTSLGLPRGPFCVCVRISRLAPMPMRILYSLGSPEGKRD